VLKGFLPIFAGQKNERYTMEQIRMVDLKNQYLKLKSEIDAAVLDVIDSTAFINGPAVQKFQKNLEHFLNCKHVIPCANGTDALQVALMSLNLSPGDEVITTSFTFVATVEVIELLKLKPVMVDVDPETFNIDPQAIRNAITSKTKVIIPVHLFGQCADMEAIMSIAGEHNIYVIEDNCQAIGADYIFSNGQKQKAGTIGHIGCTSFFPSKNLGAYGDGGAVFTNDDAIAESLRYIVNHGMVVRYYHDMVGVNSRLDSIQAAILDIKLRYLDDYATARNKAAAYYSKKLGQSIKIKTPAMAPFTTHVFHQYTCIADGISRDELIQYLGEKNIPAMIYYPVPLHLQKAYMHHGYKEGDLPVTEQLSKTVFSLPMHTELNEEQLEFICQAILEFVKEK
jgi:UDP-2-acetamido-2-deoxy-ribo-hexuluronate aminotransferase